MFARTLFRAPAKFTAQTVRKMSHGASEEQVIAEVVKWKKGTAAMLGLCVTIGIYQWVTYHHDHRDRDDMIYMNVRSKAFPWECSNCPLFDAKCWRKCRGQETEADKHETEHHEAHLREKYGEDYVSFAAKE